MWLKYAVNKAKVDHMFGGVLGVEGAELVGFKFHDVSSVYFSFLIRGVPDKCPEKWKGHGYNAMSVTLNFGGVKEFRSNLTKVNFCCVPIINSSPGSASISIEAPDASIFCESEYVSVDGVTPYIDIRWD
ncbi:Imm50 family immunity protein [Pseudomonas sp. MWU13-3659]|uniref:Imm50 family immunity protein n=1 Tax=Pseudomonas sp. MWU13-3659 TaxID=2986964 RepID=UPI00256F5F11|nr:Imm50 family immunity protein [Pseudomonas sp. MWU13-3659]